MVLKVYDRFGNIKCNYMDTSCFPTKSEITSMIKAEYKFKLDGKSISGKKIKDMLEKG